MWAIRMQQEEEEGKVSKSEVLPKMFTFRFPTWGGSFPLKTKICFAKYQNYVYASEATTQGDKMEMPSAGYQRLKGIS